MRTHLRKLMEKNDGMTLVEVIVALVLFSMVFLILLYGINGALKVMGNAQAISDATQSDVSKLESLGSSLEKSGTATLNKFGSLTVKGKAINGQFATASSIKSNDETDLSLTLFYPTTNTAGFPMPSAMPAPVPSKPIINPPDVGSAYYYLDTKYPVNTQTVLVSDGGFDQNYFSEYQRIYNKSFDTLVVKDSIQFSGNKDQVATPYVQKIYFTGNPVLSFGEVYKPYISYSVRFISLGVSGNNDKGSLKVSLTYTWDGQLDKNNGSCFILNSYDKTSDIILYTAQTLIVKRTSVGANKELEDLEFPAGFYSVPNGTNLISAFYSQDDLNAFIDTYSRTYDQVKSQLVTIGVQVQ